MTSIFSAARTPSSSSFDCYMDKGILLKPGSFASMKNSPTLWANYAYWDNAIIWDQVTTNTSEYGANNMIEDEVNDRYNSWISGSISWYVVSN